MLAPHQPGEPASPHLLALREALRARDRHSIGEMTLPDLAVEIVTLPDGLWVLIRRAGRGGLALRAVHAAVAFTARRVARGEDALRLVMTSTLGRHDVRLRCGGAGLAHLRVTVDFTPARPTVLPFVPRDLYPLDADDDPLGAQGVVEAAQRGLNSGLLYFHLDAPAFGNVLYFQNLTALNDYYRATRTSPDGAVGGEWPELGYLMPTPPQQDNDAAEPLAPGRAMTLSDAILVFRDEAPPHERESARQFLQMLGEAYRLIDRPEPVYRDWPHRAERTLHDLATAPEATIRHYGHRYVHPYTASEYPDAMVQVSVLAAVHDWGRWQGKPHPLEAELAAGLNRFYDAKLQTLRRYLPNVGKDKNADAVDSWYLYHPLLNLGRMALDGDARAKRLLLKSLPFAIRAAHHFDYKWPIQYDVTDFSVITATANDHRGQTDVGGLYAYVMLQAHALTGEARYLDEARAAIAAARGMRFNLNYQANLTAWGAAACMRLYRITDDPVYAEQSYVYLASFFHNCELWESRLEHAVHYRNFMAVTCLQDAPYMAIYECFDAFTAFEEYLAQAGPDLDPAARMLVADYCRYALDRAWFYYPDALPRDILSPENRNGHIDRKLSFPLEDLYPDGQLAGPVGQEIYGCGAAMVFAARSVHRIDGAPFDLSCDLFVRAQERVGERALAILLDGDETGEARLSLVRTKRRTLPDVHLTTASGEVVRARHRDKERIDYTVPANGRLIVSWD